MPRAEYVEPIYIPIALNSIRHNPSAYNNQYVIPASMRMEISGELDDEQYEICRQRMYDRKPFVDAGGLTVYVTQVSFGMSAKTKTSRKFQGVVHSTMTSERTLKLLQLKFGKNMTWTIHHDHEIVHSIFHERPYKFNYKDIKFACPHCSHGPLKVSTLDEETKYDGDGYECGSIDVCPRCREEIEITYQRMPETDLAQYADKNKAARKKR